MRIGVIGHKGYKDLPKILEKSKSGLVDEPAAASVDSKKPGGGG